MVVPESVGPVGLLGASLCLALVEQGGLEEGACPRWGIAGLLKAVVVGVVFLPGVGCLGVDLFVLQGALLLLGWQRGRGGSEEIVAVFILKHLD